MLWEGSRDLDQKNLLLHTLFLCLTKENIGVWDWSFKNCLNTTTEMLKHGVGA